MFENEKTCCICGMPITGFGNNPWPIKEEGECCDICNRLVVAKRIENYERRKKSESKDD